MPYWCADAHVCRRNMYTVRPDTRLPRDDEEYRLLAVYEESRAKEHAASSRLLYPGHRLSYPAYMELVSELQTIRKECNSRMLAVRAHHNKRLNPLIVAQDS
jgi:hypothetical protein